jgi:hypothetical protein
MATETKRIHLFHSEAKVLHAQLFRPLEQEVKPQAYVQLKSEGGYLAEHLTDFRIEGVISVKSAYTHVAGHKSLKANHGWTTLATSSIEGLNVMEVVTADRVVAQISLEHPLEGYVPSVTFLGTRFENLKIAGHLVDPRLDLDILGPKPAGDKLYLEDPGFLKRAGTTKTFPDLSQQWKEYIKSERRGAKPTASVECSLANNLHAKPWKATANVIDVPEFGKVFLSELKVECDTFQLTMIRLEMGCAGEGSGSAGSLIVNGGTIP